MTLSSSDTRVGELNHIGIAVMNIEKSLEQFYELFDSPEASILVNHEHAVRGAFIEQGETHIELLEPLNATSVIAKFLETHGEGIHHMAFTVGNVDTKVSELQKLGISIITGPREGFTGRIAFTNPADTHGILIELVTPFSQSHNE
ncbi:MAG: methylmalonyl-CoA epimerase [Chloroflexi bacterium]|nr:methylmalonyl-CoA epimerase [Chloroflexota bacterium]